METNVTIRLFTEDNNELDCAPIVLSATTKVGQLEQLYHQLAGKLQNEIDEELYFPINFRTKGDQDAWIEIVDSLADSLPENILFSEKPIDLFCLPQAVFYVRPVVRCSASLPGHGEPIISVKFSPNGSSLASGSGDKTVRIWDLQTQLPMKKLEGHKHWVLCIEWSPDGKKLASACKEGIIFIWDTEFTHQNGRKLEGHKQWINALSWQPLNIQPNSRLLASAGRDATIRIWDTITYNVLRILTGHKSSITAIRWGGNDLIYSGSQDRTVKVWRAGDGVLCRSLDGHAHWINTLALNVDYALRTGFYSPSQKKKDDISRDFYVKLNYYKKKYEETLNSQPERLVSGSDDFTMYLWEPALKKQPIARLTGHQQLINHVQFSPDTRLIASASFDKSIKLWDGKTGKFLSTFRGHVSPVYQISWSADSRLLVSGAADSTLKVWNAQKAKLLVELPGHGDEVFAVDWSPNGEQVASGGKDKILKLWKC